MCIRVCLFFVAVWYNAGVLIFPMKKIFLSVFVAVFVVLFSGCYFFGDKEVSSLTFVLRENGVDKAAADYSESYFRLVPDYEFRTLAVDYSVTYPNKSIDGKPDSYESSGVIGADYFDRFQKIVDLFYDLKVNPGEVGDFEVKVEYPDAEYLYLFDFNGVPEISGFADVKAFYSDLDKLFFENVY